MESTVEVLEDMVVETDKDTDEDCVYECDFDFNECLNATLSNLDVGTQVQDAIDTTSNMISILTQQYHYTALVFSGLDADIKSLNSTINKLNAATEPKIGNANAEQLIRPGNVNSPFKHVMSPVRHNASKIDSSGDVIPVARIVNKPNVLPPQGLLIKKPLVIGAHIYAIKGSPYGAWYKAKVVDVKTYPNGETMFKIKYDSRKQSMLVTGKSIAYHECADVILTVGLRIIAHYRDEFWSPTSLMYSGIIAEPPKMMNRYRYLVFFDDGYAQYVNHNEIRVVYESSSEVWNDVPSDSKDFLKNYLGQYPERPMVKLQKGHTVKTEWNGRWWIAKVIEVDASLAKMYFHADRRTEWIYRGSTRLAPLYNELANAEAIRLSGKSSRRHNLLVTKKSAPYVEYTRGTDDPFANSSALEGSGEEKRQVARKHTFSKQNVARKSTNSVSTPSAAPRANNSGIHRVLPENEGEIRNRPLECDFPTKKYIPHECGPECIKDVNGEPTIYKGQNPLTIPIRFGWQRIVAKHKSVMKTYVFYRAPCGRRLRNMDEIHQYLKITKSQLSMDLFCSDSEVQIFGEFMPTKVLAYLKDVSSGKELVPVCGVNSLDREYPDYVEYSNKRIPNKGVDLNLDPEFLVCCDCDDDCSDSSRCACQQLTKEASQALPTNRIKSNLGYTYKKLKEHVTTGIYECNHKCKCNYRCLNRVVQNGLQLRLQVFKTEKRGWGIRCLDDIPQGGFVCIYAGLLLTEQGANEDGTQFGDEYLAELDHIEVVERAKEGYESDVIESDVEGKNSDKEKADHSGSDDEAAKDESDDYNCEVEKMDDTSDSDFESAISSIGAVPRTQQTRGMEKLQKLVLRREPSDADSSNQSWNVQPSGGRSPSSDISSKEVDESSLAKSSTKNIISISSSSSTTSEGSKSKKRIESKQKEQSKSEEDKSKDKCRSFAEPTRRLGKWKPTRSYFGDEFCYIMDAKALGNIGRYLNHSCAPNVFVQNVFVDTHDLRFPWVAFFALQYIRAGTELTWDYAYDVGSVPNKVLYCYCTADKCRGRLL